MILNNFLQNIDFSLGDFENTPKISSLSIRKRLDFGEEHSKNPALNFKESKFLQKSEISDILNKKNLLQKRIRPFNLLQEEPADFMDVSDSNSYNKENNSPNDPMKSICERINENLNLKEFVG